MRLWALPEVRPASTIAKNELHSTLSIHTYILRADFWEGDATKHFSVKKEGFPVKRGEAIQ